MIKSIFSILILLANVQLGFTQTNDEYYILFTKVDNRVEVYADEVLIFNSGFIDGNPDLDLKVNFNPSDYKGKEIVIKLINGVENAEYQVDPRWEIMFEIFKNGEPVEYQHEYASNNQTGIVFEKSYKVNELIAW